MLMVRYFYCCLWSDYFWLCCDSDSVESVLINFSGITRPQPHISTPPPTHAHSLWSISLSLSICQSSLNVRNMWLCSRGTFLQDQRLIVSDSRNCVTFHVLFPTSVSILALQGFPATLVCQSYLYFAFRKGFSAKGPLFSAKTCKCKVLILKKLDSI